MVWRDASEIALVGSVLLPLAQTRKVSELYRMRGKTVVCETLDSELGAWRP